MNSLIDYTVVNTGVAFLLGAAIYYYFFMFGKNTPTVKVEAKTKEITKSREIKETCEPTVTKKTENEIKKADPVAVKVAPNNTSSLAKYDATTAKCTMSAQTYIKELYPVQRKEFVTDDITPAPRSVTATPEATKKVADIKSDNVESPKPARPFIAAFNATEALTALKARAYVEYLPKSAKPSIAISNATEAATTVVGRQEVEYLPKPAKPVLAAFNATEALTALKARAYVESLPKPARPFIAAFNATEAFTALKAREYVNSLPKAPKPVLAAYNATTASITLKEREYINSLPKVPKLAPVDVNVARAVAKSASESPKPSLAACNATIASATSDERKCVDSLPVERELPAVQNTQSDTTAAQNDTAAEADTCVAVKTVDATKKAVTSNLASVDATQASQLLHSQQDLQDKADSDTDVEIEDSSSPPSTASTSSSSIHSGTNKFAAIAAASVAASTAAAAAASASASASASNTQQSNNNFYGTTWDKLFDEGIMNNKPLSLNNTAVFNVNNAEKKEWSREEKIRKQSQSHLPKMRNRCDYWPACTNKNCKFAHPTAPCRVGDECQFGKRCSFIHPKDLIEPVKKRSNSTGVPKRNSTGVPKRSSTTGPPKRTASSDENTRNNNRNSAMVLEK